MQKKCNEVSPSVRIIKCLQIINAEESVDIKEPSYRLLVGMSIGTE